MNSKQKGDLGVVAAIQYYVSRGYSVSLPLSDAQRYDLVVDVSGILYRVEIKTSAIGKFSLRTLGGNRSWNGTTIKKLSSDDCDLIFLYNCSTGDMWEYKIAELENMSAKTPTEDHKLIRRLNTSEFTTL